MGASVNMEASCVSRRGFVKGASLGLLGASVAGAAALTGCASSPLGDTGEGGVPSRGIVEADATHQGYGGEVKVSLTVDTDQGLVTAAAVEGDGETPIKGGRAIAIMEEALVSGGSVDIDTVAGATITSSAVLSAAKEAFGTALFGDDLHAQKMTPGTYTGTAKSGYWRIIDLPVTVTVNEDSILKIETPEDRFAHGETEVILESAKRRFFPRVLENQSINVDVVSGATQSCLGVRNAMRHALEEAFEANGVNKAAAAKFERAVDLKTEAGATEEIETDLVVVGLGVGGVIALRNACEEMQKRTNNELVRIVGIDRAGKIGGKSCLTHEAFAVDPPQFAQKFNNGEHFLDKEDIRARWKAFNSTDGAMKAKEDVLDMFVDHSGDTIDWLMNHGWRYGTVAKGAGFALTNGLATFNSLLTSRADPGTYEDRRKYVQLWCEQMAQEVEAQGGRIMLETEGYELLLDGDAVAGLKARDRVTGKEYVIKAKAVIMNTGGYSSNYDMMNTLLSDDFKGFYKTVGTGMDTGLMIQAALDAGAGTFNMEMAPILMHCGTDHWLEKWPFNEFEDQLQNRTGRANVWTLNNIPLGCAYSYTAVALKATDGTRFMNEAQFEDFSQSIDVDSFAHWRGGANYYCILSKDVLDPIMAEGFNAVTWDGYNTQGKIPPEMPIPELYEGLDLAVEEGIAFKADTLAELAGLIGMENGSLERSIKEYNDLCAAGEDTAFGKDPQYLVKLETGPFYAVKILQSTFGTCGGLDVDASLTVLKDDHATPIKGLYAIGLDSMGVIHNPDRHYCGFGGVAQGWLQTGGRLAGANAVAYIQDAYGLTPASRVYSDIPASF